MLETFDRRVVPAPVLEFIRACQSRVPCHLGGGAALAGAYLGHRMTGDVGWVDAGLSAPVGCSSDLRR